MRASRRLAGAELGGRRGLVARISAAAAASELGAERAFDSAEQMVRDPDDRRRPHLHAEPPPPAARGGRPRRRQARGLREAAGAELAGARRLADVAAEVGLQAAVPFVYRYYPTVREARERVRSRADGRAPPAARHLPSGLAPAARRRQLAGGRAAGRRLPRVRRHRLPLVRPRRVRLRPSHHAALGAAAHGGARARERARHARVRPAAATGEARAGHDRGRRARPVRDRRGRARLGRRRARSRRDARTGSGSRSTAPRRHSRSTRSTPKSCGAGVVSRLTIVRRDPASSPPAAARFASLPAGHPQGYADCFDAFVADFYEAVRGGALPEGTPTFADGLRAASITDAVLASSSRDGEWVDVAARRRAAPRRWRREARLPDLVHARAQPRGNRRLGRRERLRGARGRRLAAAGRPAVHREPHEGRRIRRGRGTSACARLSRITGSSLSALAYYDNNLPPIRPSARRITRTSAAASTLRRRSAASLSAPSSAAIPERASLRTCARRSASFRRSSTTRANAACA